MVTSLWRHPLGYGVTRARRRRRIGRSDSSTFSGHKQQAASRHPTQVSRSDCRWQRNSTMDNGLAGFTAGSQAPARGRQRPQAASAWVRWAIADARTPPCATVRSQPSGLQDASPVRIHDAEPLGPHSNRFTCRPCQPLQTRRTRRRRSPRCPRETQT